LPENRVAEALPFENGADERAPFVKQIASQEA
jgi:hypothetical protein